MDVNDLFAFLNALKENNNRDWFNEHKDWYLKIRDEWFKAVQCIIDKMATYDSSLKSLNAESCVFRIYRDVRFSKNKAPYKTYFSAVIGKGGRKCYHSCYYLHVQPDGNSGLYGGLWCPEPRTLNAIRHSIDDNFEEFDNILNSKGIKGFYNLTGDKLKTAPKGFSKENPHLEYLNFKEYILEHQLDDKFFKTPDWTDTVAEKFMPMQKFHRFLNFTIDEEL